MNANAIGAAMTAAFVIYLIAKGRIGIYLGLLTGGSAAAAPASVAGSAVAPGLGNVIQFPGVPNLSGSGSL
jgi:hypothetical protein